MWEASLPDVRLNKSVRHEPKRTIPANWGPRRETLPQDPYGVIGVQALVIINSFFLLFYKKLLFSKCLVRSINDMSLPYFFYIFKDLVEIGFPSYSVSPRSTHAKTCATSLFYLSKNENKSK